MNYLGLYENDSLTNDLALVHKKLWQ